MCYKWHGALVNLHVHLSDSNSKIQVNLICLNASCIHKHDFDNRDVGVVAHSLDTICAGVGDVSGEMTGKNRACVSSLHPQQPAWIQITSFFSPQF